MFVIQLKFSDNNGRAAEWMEGHKRWIRRGFDDGVFLVVGSLEPGPGGGILAHGVSLADLRERVAEDPFVEHHVVEPEILEIRPSMTDERLAFLRG